MGNAETPTRDPIPSSAPLGDVVFLSPRNWTASIFFLLLGLIHLCVGAAGVFHHRWEAYLSLALSPLFLAIAGVAACFRFEMSVFPERRLITIRRGVGRIQFARTIVFGDIRCVRLTLSNGHPRESVLELLCRDGDDLECPRTAIPRQQALYFAMAIGVPLQKVCTEEQWEEPVAEPESETADCPPS